MSMKQTGQLIAETIRKVVKDLDARSLTSAQGDQLTALIDAIPSNDSYNHFHYLSNNPHLEDHHVTKLFDRLFDPEGDPELDHKDVDILNNLQGHRKGNLINSNAVNHVFNLDPSGDLGYAQKVIQHAKFPLDDDVLQKAVFHTNSEVRQELVSHPDFLVHHPEHAKAIASTDPDEEVRGLATIRVIKNSIDDLQQKPVISDEHYSLANFIHHQLNDPSPEVVDMVDGGIKWWLKNAKFSSRKRPIVPFMHADDVHRTSKDPSYALPLYRKQ